MNIRLVLSRLLPLLALALSGAAAMAQTDPPARVANLSYLDGGVVFAPAGETEWADAVVNRPVTRGDRLWTDRGAKAELHAGEAVLHLDGETFLDIKALDDRVLQASLNEGAVSARVRRLEPGENFEVDTPQLAFRAAQPGDYRIDVDPKQATTRVTVRSGEALVYGANGQGQQLGAGQQATFTGRELQRVASSAVAQEDGFDRWAMERDRQEDQSIAARHVPREVVGYQQLDAYGSWAEDTSYGAVWYPRVTVADWAPYRYGHWEWIAPWGWTWIDDAPWGFAPFHYGRWAMIGSRWAWVPGRIGPRPVYAPALVAFVGDGGGISLSIGGPGIGWFPLAPGEAWRPAYRTTAVYFNSVNRYLAGGYRNGGGYLYQHRPSAFTAVRIEDFSRGRPIHDHWRTLGPVDLTRTQVLASTALPAPQRFAESHRPGRMSALSAPRLPAPAFSGRAQPLVQAPGSERRDWAEQRRAVPIPRDDSSWQRERQQQEARQAAQRRVEEQRQQQLQHERIARDQQARQERAQREQQVQAMRHQEEQRRQQAQIQREHALRQQQAAQEQFQRQQWQQQRAFREPPVQVQRQAEGFDRGRPGGHGVGRGRGPEARDEGRPQREDDGGRGHGHGRG